MTHYIFTTRPKTCGSDPQSGALVFYFIRKIKLITKVSRFYWRSTDSYIIVF